MFYLTPENVDQFIEANWEKFVCDEHKSGTWTGFSVDKDEITKLHSHIYGTSCSRGVLEPPIKFSLRNLVVGFCTSEPHSSDTLSFTAPRLYLNMIRNRILNPNRMKNEYAVVVEMGFNLPQSNGLDYDDIHYKFERGLFNSNIRRYASQINSINRLPLGADFSVCEIGAGYGGFAELFCLNEPGLNNYYIVDIFEVLAVAMIYLTKRMDKKMCVAESISDLKDAKLEDCIVFIPSSLASSILDCKDIGLVINSSSLMEMPKAEVDRYFGILNQMKGVWFYNYNAISRKEDGRLVEYDKLPYDAKWNTYYDRIITIDGLVSNMRETIRCRVL
jgi:hypothetical protein